MQEDKGKRGDYLLFQSRGVDASGWVDAVYLECVAVIVALIIFVIKKYELSSYSCRRFYGLFIYLFKSDPRVCKSYMRML